MPGIRYTAVFERDDKGMWLVDLAEEPRVHSYGRTLAAARDGIHQVAATWFHLEPAVLELVEDIRLPEGIKARVENARRLREHAQAAQLSAQSETRDVAQLLVKSARLSLRDAADVLGLSPQRIQQLLAD